MTWRISVAGTIDSDQVTTPYGSSDVMLGGSAIYFSLAAARYVPVWLNGIVGDDWAERARDAVSRWPIHLDGLVVSDDPTSRWIATHFEDGSTVDHFTDEGANSHWTGEIPASGRDAEILFLASMRPDLQLRVVDQCTPRLVGLNTMTFFTPQEDHTFRRLIDSVDMLFVNREEIASITGGPVADWASNAHSLLDPRRGRLRAVIVTAGHQGAALVTAERVVERPAHRVAHAVDVTGAGDAFAGGFLGACAAAKRDDDAFLPTALDEGIIAATPAVITFGVDGLCWVLDRKRFVTGATPETV
jgi:sugar/nucleoside kinase (ribokinase family)